MPNHCVNFLWLDGEKQEVDALLAVLAGPNGAVDFNRILPYPEKYGVMDADKMRLSSVDYEAKYGQWQDGYNSGGYDWCCDTWGTKWNAYEIARLEQPMTGLVFQTAWSPPTPVIEKLAEQFPDVMISLEYFERCMCFCGGARWRASEDVDEGEERCRTWQGEYNGTLGG